MLVAWFKALRLAGKLAVASVLAIVAIVSFFFLRDLFVGTAKVEARLGTTQAEAALASGNDAAQTVGTQAEREAARAASLAEGQKDVNDAEDPAAAHAAGAGWLCVNAGICADD